uniref:Procollagen C-endopeptidase enhancer b n=1 Tax=Sander lucioperca TaxID=283035 RepID=A0A8C9YDW8_SANLU
MRSALLLSVKLCFLPVQQVKSSRWWLCITLFRPIFHCGGHLVTDTGIVASEGFPSHYKPNSKCTWYITVPEGHVVMLSFRLFDMEADPTCRYDYLDVYNGHTRLVQKLGRFCGTFRPGALISTSNTMMLDMVSDDATGGRGFLASFSAGKPHVEGNQFCGGRLTKSQGSVKTPNWPNSNYPAGISCSWHISVEPSNVIEVKFVKLDLEADMYCRYDYVALFNGGERDNSRRIGKFCGDSLNPPQNRPKSHWGRYRRNLHHANLSSSLQSSPRLNPNQLNPHLKHL